jgi:hypothetical protein
MRTAAGFSIHTGWAAMVVLEGPPANLVAKSKLELADSPEHRFVYHAAREQPAAAARMIQKVERLAREAAARALGALPKGTILALPPAKRKLPELRAILASHPLLHSAEGELYRNAIVEAAALVGLAVVYPAEPRAPDLPKQKPPWGKDQRGAAALAWAALSSKRP